MSRERIFEVVLALFVLLFIVSFYSFLLYFSFIILSSISAIFLSIMIGLLLALPLYMSLKIIIMPREKQVTINYLRKALCKELKQKKISKSAPNGRTD